MIDIEIPILDTMSRFVRPGTTGFLRTGDAEPEKDISPGETLKSRGCPDFSEAREDFSNKGEGAEMVQEGQELGGPSARLLL